MNLALLQLILKYHAGQMRVGRKDGQQDPQIEHIFRIILRLMSPVPHFPESLQMVRMNALPIIIDVIMAHDLLEDTDIPEKELEEVIHPYAFEAVKALTRPPKEEMTYAEYIEKQILPNPIASFVKLGDIEDNYEHAKESLRNRYAEAKTTIMNHWNKMVFPPQEEAPPRIITDPNAQ